MHALKDHAHNFTAAGEGQRSRSGGKKAGEGERWKSGGGWDKDGREVLPLVACSNVNFMMNVAHGHAEYGIK